MSMNRFRLTILCGVFLLSACGGTSSQGLSDPSSHTSQTENEGNSATPTSIQMGGATKGKALSLSQTVSTIAGIAPGTSDGIGAAARFNKMYAVASDGANLFVADAVENTIRKIAIGTGEVTTLAGAPGVSGSTDGAGSLARFNKPNGITISPDGATLFVADTGNHTVRKVVIATGEVTTLAGSAGSPGLNDGSGTSAKFKFPYCLTTDGTNVFVPGFEHSIRKIVIASGEVTTLVTADSAGALVFLNQPHGITMHGGNLYVADTFNHVIRKVDIASGLVTILAGTVGATGAVDGLGSTARFYSPWGIATDGTSLFVTDYYNQSIRKIAITTGEVTPLAGKIQTAGSVDGAGTAARFNNPTGIAAVGSNLFVTDCYNYTIRRIETGTGIVTTVAGTASPGVEDGPGAAARFNMPHGITTDGTNLFVIDSRNHTIRKVVIATGTVTTLAGTAGVPGSDDGPGNSAKFYRPGGITTDGAHLFVADAGNHIIRKVELATGIVTTLAGSAGISGSADGTATVARFKSPYDVTTDGTHIYVADTFNHTIRKIVAATGVVMTVAGSPGTQGAVDGISGAATFTWPYGITTDGANLYVADNGNSVVRKIVISTGEVSTLAKVLAKVALTTSSSATQPDVQQVPTAQSSQPAQAVPAISGGITTDGEYLYIVNTRRSTIFKVAVGTGAVTTLAGSDIQGSSDGTEALARFSSPLGITTDGTSLFIADSGNNTIRKIN